MNRIKKALEKCRTYVAVQKFGCGHTGIGHGVEDNLLQLLNEAFEELARLEKREPTLMSDCISAGLPLDVALKYDVQLCRLTNYVRDKTLADCVKQEPVAWHDKIKGMEVSVDVSTGEDDAHHRVFGRVDSVMLESCGAQEDIILVIEESRNYAAPVDAKAIRSEALEEAAKWFEDEEHPLQPKKVAAAIRRLK